MGNSSTREEEELKYTLETLLLDLLRSILLDKIIYNTEWKEDKRDDKTNGRWQLWPLSLYITAYTNSTILKHLSRI